MWLVVPVLPLPVVALAPPLPFFSASTSPKATSLRKASCSPEWSPILLSALNKETESTSRHCPHLSYTLWAALRLQRGLSHSPTLRTLSSEGQEPHGRRVGLCLGPKPCEGGRESG